MAGDTIAKQPWEAPLEPEPTGYPGSNIVVLAGVTGTDLYVRTQRDEPGLGGYTRFI